LSFWNWSSWPTSIRSGASTGEDGLKVGSPNVKDQTYITPELAYACGRDLGDPSASPQQRPSLRTNLQTGP
jgi:hypothetical protein